MQAITTPQKKRPFGRFLSLFYGVPAGIRTPTSGSGGLRDIPFTTGTSAKNIITFAALKVKRFYPGNLWQDAGNTTVKIFFLER